MSPSSLKLARRASPLVERYADLAAGSTSVLGFSLALWACKAARNSRELLIGLKPSGRSFSPPAGRWRSGAAWPLWMERRLAGPFLAHGHSHIDHAEAVPAENHVGENDHDDQCRRVRGTPWAKAPSPWIGASQAESLSPPRRSTLAGGGRRMSPWTAPFDGFFRFACWRRPGFAFSLISQPDGAFRRCRPCPGCPRGAL